jgi:hypothetical protein
MILKSLTGAEGLQPVLLQVPLQIGVDEHRSIPYHNSLKAYNRENLQELNRL